jgi:hypothetical protein
MIRGLTNTSLTSRKETNVQLASLWAVLVTLTGAGSLTLVQGVQRDCVQPVPPEGAKQTHRESLL